MLEHLGTTLSCLGGGHDRAGAFGDSRSKLLVVADGAGGASGAALAAQLVTDVVREIAAQALHPMGPRDIVALLERLDLLLLSNRHAGQSTAVIAQVVEDRLWGASVGDSGAWLVHGRHHIDLTERQQRKWRLGSGLARPVTFGPIPLVGTLLLATDGLLDFATPDRLAAAIDDAHPLSDVAGSLVRRVRLPNGALRDDVGFVLCREDPRAVERRAVA